MYATDCIKVTYRDIDGTLVTQGYYRNRVAFKHWIKELNEKRGAEYAKITDYKITDIELWDI